MRSDLLRDCRCALGLLVVLGCADGNPRTEFVATVPGDGASLPALVEAFTSADIATSPVGLSAAPVVGGDGTMLLVADEAEDEQIALVDTTGRVLSRFGRSGDGPDEMRSPNPIGLTATHAFVFDVANLRILRWSRSDGTSEVMSLGGDRIIPFFLVTDSVAFAVAAGPGGGTPGLLNLFDAHLTPLVSPNDSARTAMIEALKPLGKRPIVGWWGGGVVLGNAMDYELVLYGMDGEPTAIVSRGIPRPSPSAIRIDAELEALARSPVGRNWSPEDIAQRREKKLGETMAHFSGRPMRTDGMGRMWVVGQADDSAYADVFAGDRLLGRIGIGCKGFLGSWSIRGHWLAMSCEPQDPDFPGDAVVQLYRIEEPL